MIHDTQSAQVSQKHDERNIYVIMKTMCPTGYHHNITNIYVTLFTYIYINKNICKYIYVNK